jgi:hypothetical protein
VLGTRGRSGVVHWSVRHREAMRAEHVTGRVSYVRDGNTIELAEDGRPPDPLDLFARRLVGSQRTCFALLLPACRQRPASFPSMKA